MVLWTKLVMPLLPLSPEAIGLSATIVVELMVVMPGSGGDAAAEDAVVEDSADGDSVPGVSGGVVDGCLSPYMCEII